MVCRASAVLLYMPSQDHLLLQGGCLLAHCQCAAVACFTARPLICCYCKLVACKRLGGSVMQGSFEPYLLRLFAGWPPANGPPK